jgi:hypothetical protein
MGENREDKFINVCFPQPPNKGIRVWRYLDLAKFIWLLDRRKLFLPRLDSLEDPHEGSVTEKLALAYERFIRTFVPECAEKDLQSLSQYGRDLRKASYVSCWRMSNIDSHAMWRIYCGADQGVAIQTTYEKLASSITDSEMHIGFVRYIDYDENWFSKGNFIPSLEKSSFYRIMHKWREFCYEEEVRIVRILYDPYLRLKTDGPDGIHMDWNLEEVIEHIYIHPYAPTFYFDAVNAVVRKFTPDLESRVQWSNMNSRPPLYR